MRRFAPALLCCALACAHAAEEAADILISPEEEKRLGENLEARIRQEARFLRISEVLEYVQEVGGRMTPAAAKDYPQMDYQWHVIDDPKTVNAFAIPGGHLHVYTGLLLAVDDEAELAAVLGHELGHVAARHGPQQLVRAMGLNLVAGLALGANPSVLAQLAANVAAQGYMMKYSRDMEREADDRGLGYMVFAGYDPHALSGFFRDLEKLHERKPGAVESFFASHPEPGERAARIDAEIAARRLRGGVTFPGRLQGIQDILKGHYGISRARVSTNSVAVARRRSPSPSRAREEGAAQACLKAR